MLGQQGCQGSDSDTDEDEYPTTEVRFVPSEPSCLSALFQAMNACQALHPDSECSDDFGGKLHYLSNCYVNC